MDTFIDTFKGSTDEMLTEMGKNKIQGSLFYGLIRLMNHSSFKPDDLTKNPIGSSGFEKRVAAKNTKKYKELFESGRRKDLEAVYQDFSSFLLISDSNREKYFNTLKKEGYNAVMDQNDMKNYGSVSPVIVFDAKKSLSVVRSTEITDKMADKAFARTKKNEHAVYKLKKQEAGLGWSAI